MNGKNFNITLTEDAKPFCDHTPRAILFTFREKLKAQLELLQEKRIIAPVTAPTEWCAPIVVTPKKGTDNLSCLNKFVKREKYQSVTPA